MPPKRQLIVLGILGIVLIALGVVTYVVFRGQEQDAQDFTAVPVPVDYPAPVLSLTDLQGEAVELADYRGQVILVNLWATWCPPCKAEMPVLVEYFQEYADDGFVIVAIDDGEDPGTVQDYADGHGLIFPIWLDPQYATEKAFRTINLPSSWVIDRSGRVRLAWVGAISRRSLDKYVTPLIRE
jgi:thiol-disulfide isomerase/thioredoxin